MEVYVNGIVAAGPELELIENATLIVENGKIAAIERQPREHGIDLKGGLVIPAFVDAHTHIADTGAKELGTGMLVEDAVLPPNGLKHRYLQQLSEERLIETIRQGLKEMLKSGVAAFGDFREGGLDGIRALRKASRGLPIRPVILGRPMADYKAGFELTRKELEAVAEEADGFGISSINAFGLEVYHQIREIVGDKVFAIHLSESPRDHENSLQTFGETEVKRAFAFEPDLMVHLTHATESDLVELKARSQRIACCPRTNLILGDGIPPLHEFFARGIPISIGSDNMMFSSPDLFREMDTASRVTRGATKEPRSIDSSYLLRSATFSGAQALKLDRAMGSLEPGKDATFLVLDTSRDPFVYTHDLVSSVVHRCGPSDISRFVCAGTTVIEDFEFKLNL
ncbi:amidohydrolase family protein [Cohnella massiliensis]|uniref:amidohydrolase family protein n=1 Tax=Cohnella massiliensis TaxID=1816691 RepID=UPI0009BA0473|nr:amidohydrolase family protein [Cohnella massiliensis]